ncbi:IS256 family transposase [Chakrabartyella piscis]|uniref:IS256 family transposase n=1 Tax=Chakrabartyella piscis TaxID=2918914 RepID=UPI002958A3DC|nr:IS256 family transposase [Chakrabartyella piscis]
MKTTKHGLSEREQELVGYLISDCKTTGDIQEKLKQLFAGTIEQMLEAEIDEHLGYEKNSVEGNNSGNSRNGYGKKTIISDYGACEIAVPRDRNGEFRPQIIEKRQTRTDEIEQKIMAMYAKGMSQRDIEDTLREIYGSEISQGMISKITDRILPEVNEWQNRPLDKIYPVVFFDGIVFNSKKDGKIINKCVYSVLAINMEGHKEILGTWISENESASFYASICADLKNRGVSDIFVACHDNLTGLNEAIQAIFPQTKNQLCIVHQIRNSCKFVPYKDRKAVCADLKKIYGAVNLDDAEYAKEEFREKWDKKYPNILKSWDRNWAELTVFFEYPAEIRKIIYTTNAVEAYHRMVRKFTKSKAILPTDDSIRKVVYLSVSEIRKKWTMPVRDWGLAYAQFAVFFESRFVA